MVARFWELRWCGGEWVVTAKVSEDSFGGEENVLKWNVVMVAQLYEI